MSLTDFVVEFLRDFIDFEKNTSKRVDWAISMMTWQTGDKVMAVSEA